MDYSQAFAISAAGMTVERTRADIASLNLANANTVLTVGGAGYQPLRVIARGAAGAGQPVLSFASNIEQGLNSAAATTALLPRADVEPSTAAPRMVYEPGNPFANEKGFVAYPGVDAANEMVNMMSALRGYEANVAAMNMARSLALKALEIGSGS